MLDFESRTDMYCTVDIYSPVVPFSQLLVHTKVSKMNHCFGEKTHSLCFYTIHIDQDVNLFPCYVSFGPNGQ